MWLDNTCIDRYEKMYFESTPQQQKEILDLIAYARMPRTDPASDKVSSSSLSFAKLTADGFFTSEIGIEYLGYIGNTLRERISRMPACSRSLRKFFTTKATKVHEGKSTDFSSRTFVSFVVNEFNLMLAAEWRFE